MSPRNAISHIYNPANQSKEELLDNFVIRHNVFDKIFRAIKSSQMEVPEQHYIIQGQRGTGKTTLLLKLAYEVENDPDLAARLIPVRLNEEQYNIFSLCRLWETVADHLEEREGFSGLSEALEQHFETDDYPEFCFRILEKAVQNKGKKLLLLFDNIGDFFEKLTAKESRQLRDILHKTCEIRIVAGSAKTLEATFRHDKPFFEFFKTIYLDGLSKEETETLLLQLAKNYKEPKVEQIVREQKSRIEALRRLTGGIPRTIILLFEIFVDESGNVFQDLEMILDRITPLYKHRMDDLSGRQQAIMHEVALGWDAVGASDIAKRVRMPSRVVSAQLKELEKNNLVRSRMVDQKNKLYFIAERFFNIWYLMRYGRKKHADQVIWLVRFLEGWCGVEEIRARVSNHLKLAREGRLHPKGAYYMCEALAQCVGDELQHELIAGTRDYLAGASPELAANLSRSDRELFEEATKLYDAKKYDQALRKFQNIRKQYQTVFYNIGLIYQTVKKDFDNAVRYYQVAAENGHAGAMCNLGLLYQKEKGDLELAVHYYQMAVEKGHADAMYNLGLLYQKEKGDLELAVRYYQMAVEKGHADAMYNLGLLNNTEKGDLDLAVHYYKMAVEKGHAFAMYNLGVLNDTEKGDLDLAVHYYQMAVDKGDVDAINNLAWLYIEQNRQKGKSLELANRAVAIEPDENRIHTLAVALLWNDQFSESVATFQRFLQHEPFERLSEDITHYLVFLLAKKQHHLLLQLFKDEKYQLTDRYKPIYFALMHRMRDEYPKEYKKMGEELAQTVTEILEQADEMAKFYR